jgi:hypothetical protein
MDLEVCMRTGFCIRPDFSRAAYDRKYVGLLEALVPASGEPFEW